MSEKVCRKCGVVLDDDNWYGSLKKVNSYICKKCLYKQTRLWRANNHEKVLAQYTRYHRRQGQMPMSENRECPSFLGVHVAERVLSHIFNDVVIMPYGNPGYDIVCNRGKLIDSKASCMTFPRGSLGKWQFIIDRNKIADYFVLLAFDNRDDTNPLYCWMIPGDVINHLVSATISVSTIHKWDEYKLDINKISACCDTMKNGGIHNG